jgi:hypothetical protein
MSCRMARNIILCAVLFLMLVEFILLPMIKFKMGPWLLGNAGVHFCFKTIFRHNAVVLQNNSEACME